MSNFSILEDLPVVYKKLLPDFFSTSQVPREELATCHNCAMVCRDEAKDKEKLAMRPFLDDRKCCTYYPSLPGYLVGGILSDGDFAEGASRVRDKIKQKISITPMGVYQPDVYQVLYGNQQGGFGNSKSLLCPYFERNQGNCTIWKYREAICSTYFCKSIAGEKGKQFWNSVNSYLGHVQNSLSEYVLLESGLDVGYIFDYTHASKKLTAEMLDNQPPLPEVYQKLWRHWEGREEEFYIHAYELAQQLGKEKFNAITGIRQEVLLGKVIEKRKEMLDLPDRLKTVEGQLPVNDEPVKKIHFRTIDTEFELPSVVLKAFDGQSSYQEVLNVLDEKEGISLEKNLLLSLYRYGILENAN